MLIPRLASPSPTKVEERDKVSNFNGPLRPTASQILSNFSHFRTSLAIQPRANQRYIIFKGLCQNSLQSLGSNVLKSRHEFSSLLQNLFFLLLLGAETIQIACLWLNDSPSNAPFTSENDPPKTNKANYSEAVRRLSEPTHDKPGMQVAFYESA